VSGVRALSLHIYPVKGARGIRLDSVELYASGFRNDRRFMVIDEDGVFVSQRKHPRLALVVAAIEEGCLVLSVAGESCSRTLPIAPLETAAARRRVRIWGDEVDAVDAGAEAAELFSDHLGRRCSLVYMPHNVIRSVERPYGQPNDRVGFADAYPVLIASLASLDDLNARLDEPVSMDRFRPNIVVEGGEPFAEEQAKTVRVGNVVLRTPKRCARCQVITVDQATAQTSKEPLRTLASYRKEANNVYFAMNAIPELAPDASIVVQVGDDVFWESD
jgi:uncharacterized protein YcbX